MAKKQVYDLTVDDLRQFPVWRYVLGEEGVSEQDEATVSPLAEIPAITDDRSQVVLAARFTLADGTVQYGTINCPARSEWGISDLLPAIVAPGGMFSVWLGVRQPTPEAIAAEYERIGKTARQVFPAQLESLVAVDGEHIRADVEGFYHYDWEPGMKMYPFEKHLRLRVTVGA